MNLVFTFLVLLFASTASAAVDDTACSGAATDVACVTLDYNDLTTQQQTDLAAYYNLFTTMPEIASAIPYRVLPQAYRAAIWDEFETSRVSGVPSQPLPSGAEPTQNWDNRTLGGASVYLSESETINLVAARVAHAFYLEINAIVPWSLLTYKPEWLDGLFRIIPPMIGGANQPHMSALLKYWEPDGVATGSGHPFTQPDPHYATLIRVIDTSPSDTMATALTLTGTLTTHWDAIKGVMEIGDTFKHGSEPITPTVAAPTDAYIVKYENVNTGEIRRWSRGGCHSMTIWTNTLLRSINIPGTYIIGRNEGTDHASTWLPSIGKVQQHGDNYYESQYIGIPVMERLVPSSVWEKFIIPRLPENVGGAVGNDAVNKANIDRLESLVVYGYPNKNKGVRDSCSANFVSNFASFSSGSFPACEDSTVVHELCDRGRIVGDCLGVACPGD